MNKKIVVALICQFSNEYVQSKIKPYKRVDETHPWISSTIEGLKKHKSIELHVISPHNYLLRDVYFSEDNIHYHFFSIGIPLIHRHWPRFFRFDLWTKYRGNRKKISDITKKIKPDLVHLFGAENAYYSSSILDLQDHKHLVTIQGFVYKEVSNDAPPNQSYRVKIEKEIMSVMTNFGIECGYMIDEISRLNSKAKFFWHRIPINIPVYENGKKNIDIIYFGRVTRQKGAEDFIKVIAIIVKKYPGIKAGIAGPIDNYYKKHLLNLAAKNGCLKNITFLGFFPTQLQLHKIISGAKIYLFPTYNDTIPGTIVEAMFLRVMIITYQTGGIPDFNDSEKIVEIVPQGDFEKLAERAIEFLEDDVRREEMMSKAYEYVLNNYGFERPITELVNIYKEIAGNNGKTASQKIKQFETKVSLN